MGFTGYFEILTEYLMAFAYWNQVALFACGLLCGYLLRIIALKLRIRQIKIKGENRNMVMIEQRGKKAKKKNKVNSDYFMYIDNAQYSRENPGKRKNDELGVSSIEH